LSPIQLNKKKQCCYEVILSKWNKTNSIGAFGVHPLELEFYFTLLDLIFNETFIKQIIENLIEQQYLKLCVIKKRGEEGTFEA